MSLRFIKVDIEGFEAEALAGLATAVPRVVVRVSAGHARDRARLHRAALRARRIPLQLVPRRDAPSSERGVARPRRHARALERPARPTRPRATSTPSEPADSRRRCERRQQQRGQLRQRRDRPLLRRERHAFDEARREERLRDTGVARDDVHRHVPARSHACHARRRLVIADQEQRAVGRGSLAQIAGEICERIDERLAIRAAERFPIRHRCEAGCDVLGG